MKALLTTGEGGLRLAEVDDPDIRSEAGEGQIELRATSLNRGNIRQIKVTPPDTIPGWDVAGVDEQGRRVVGLVESGAFATKVAVRSEWMTSIPDGIAFETAAALPVAFVTALQVLRHAGNVSQGERVLITGAAGGVGSAAVQIAKSFGAHVTGLASSRERARFVELCGADEVHMGRPLSTDRYDVILNAVSGESLTRSIDLLRPHGRVVLFGASSGEPARFDPRALYSKSCSVVGYSIFNSPWSHRIGKDLSTLLARIREGTLDVHVHDVVPFSDVDRALASLDSRTVRGKVILTP